MVVDRGERILAKGIVLKLTSRTWLLRRLKMSDFRGGRNNYEIFMNSNIPQPNIKFSEIEPSALETGISA